MTNLIAIPVYNEQKNLAEVLRKTLEQSVDATILVIDDGSTDGTPDVLAQFPMVEVVRHSENRGYGAALHTAFQFGCDRGFRTVVTMDSDGQHEPALIPEFLNKSRCYDIVSGSRYLKRFDSDTGAPPERRRINLLITDQLNARLGLHLTDAFCGFKAYRTDALRRLKLHEAGYAMPLQLWVQAACLKLSITEVAVPCIYLDPSRTFGEHLDDADVRLAYYQEVLDQAIDRARKLHGCPGSRSTQPSCPPCNGG